MKPARAFEQAARQAVDEIDEQYPGYRKKLIEALGKAISEFDSSGSATRRQDGIRKSVVAIAQLETGGGAKSESR